MLIRHLNIKKLTIMIELDKPSTFSFRTQELHKHCKDFNPFGSQSSGFQYFCRSNRTSFCKLQQIYRFYCSLYEDLRTKTLSYPQDSN